MFGLPDDDPAYTFTKSRKSVVQFRDHAPCDQLLTFQLPVFFSVQYGYPGLLIMDIEQNTALLKAENKVYREGHAQSLRDFLCYGIGIRIEQLPCPVV